MVLQWKTKELKVALGYQNKTTGGLDMKFQEISR
jgi:hypothetical protein